MRSSRRELGQIIHVAASRHQNVIMFIRSERGSRKFFSHTNYLVSGRPQVGATCEFTVLPPRYGEGRERAVELVIFNRTVEELAARDRRPVGGSKHKLKIRTA